VVVGYAEAVVLARPALWWPFATLFVLTQIVIGLGIQFIVTPLAGWRDAGTWSAWLGIVGAWLAWSAVSTKRILDYLDPHRPALGRGAAALLVMLAVLPVTIYASQGTFFYTDHSAAGEDANGDETEEDADAD